MVKVKRTSSVRLSLLMALAIVGVTPAVISPSFSSRSLSELEEDLEDIMEGNDDDDGEVDDDNSNGNNGDSERAVPSEGRSTDDGGGDGDDEEIRVFTDNPPDYPLYVTSYQFDEQSLLDRETLNVDGEIKNNDTDTADFVKLTATFYDANNGTLGSDIAFTDPTTLEPGQSAPFRMIGGALGNLDVDEIRYIKFHLSSQ